MGWIIAIVVAFFIIKAIASNNTPPKKNITTVQPTVVKEPPKPALQYPTEKKTAPVVQPVVSGASIKCPVCKVALPSGAEKCSSCGFDELQREFINADDAASWFENVIVPYRVKWEQSKNQPAFYTADELYAQMVASQTKGISNHIDESATEFGVADYLDGVEIIQYNGNSAKIIIPQSINGKPVYKLADSLFENYKWLTEVVLPNGLTSIGSKAFRCTGLTHIVFPSSLVEIGAGAFEYTPITEIVFPPSVKIIPTHVCYTCKKLATVIIMGATEIGEYAFAFCESITKLALPETLIMMKNAAFACCHALTEVVLPASLQSIYGDFKCSSTGVIVALNDNLVWRPAAKDTISSIFVVTVYCNPGSTTQQHARDRGMKVKLLSEYQH